MALSLLVAVSWNRVPVAEHVPGNPSACVPSNANNWCAPEHRPLVEELVERLGGRGMECSTTPTLTDTIVYQHRDDERVEIVMFDDALTLSEHGLGWVQAYCVTPS